MSQVAPFPSHRPFPFSSAQYEQRASWPVPQGNHRQVTAHALACDCTHMPPALARFASSPSMLGQGEASSWQWHTAPACLYMLAMHASAALTGTPIPSPGHTRTYVRTCLHAYARGPICMRGSRCANMRTDTRVPSSAAAISVSPTQIAARNQPAWHASLSVGVH